jgi:hypothetical protein
MLCSIRYQGRINSIISLNSLYLCYRIAAARMFSSVEMASGDNVVVPLIAQSLEFTWSSPPPLHQLEKPPLVVATDHLDLAPGKEVEEILAYGQYSSFRRTAFSSLEIFLLIHSIEGVLLLDKLVSLIMDNLWAEVYGIFSMNLERKYIATTIKSP